MSTAIAIQPSTIVRVNKETLVRLIDQVPAFAKLLIPYLLSRVVRVQKDLIDQFFNSSEKRLARSLLLLANFGKEGRSKCVLPRVNQEHLAQMVGTTRSRVSHFMNKFRELGFVDYDGANGGLTVHSDHLSVFLEPDKLQ